MGVRNVANTYGNDQAFLQTSARSGMGSGMQKVTAQIESGEGLLESINKDSDHLSDFGTQTKTEAMKGFEAMVSSD